VKLIVGLGNPGPKYHGTRHNVGFDVIDCLSRRWNIDLPREKFHAFFGDGILRDQQVALLKPTTYMNRSGDAVLAAGRFYKLEKDDLIVVLDDWALPTGQLRIRPQGSGGSHNGLNNVIQRVGFADFARLRIGIGKASGSPTQFVLTRFDPDEVETVKQSVESAASAIELWATQGIDAAMNQYNKKTENE
jgi:peptidyl-tRNA hydrolase, PTH1 family